MINKKFVKRVLICSAFISIFASCGIFLSCGSTSGIAKGSSKSAYYESNINDFFETELDNGIPVVFKKNAGSQIAVVRLVFEGGVPLIKYEKSGIEEITLNLMIHGSKNYSYQKIQRLQYEKSFSISKSSSKDYSVVGMSCIKRDFDEVLDVFSDSVLNPLFLDKDFNQQMKLESDNLKSRLNDPMGKTGIVLTESVFKNHPYMTTISVNEKSVSNITIQDVKNHHLSLLNASRIKIVVVGNFKEEDNVNILSKLNGYFGKIEKKSYERPSIPEIEFDSTKITAECSAAGEIGYAEGLFKCPNRNSEEYVPYVIAAMYIDDSLFKIVREKNSAVYSVGTGVVGARKFAGAISLFKISKTDGLMDMITESIADFPKTEREVRAKLDSYKNKYITSVFENSQTVGGIAGNIVASMIYKDSATEYLNRTAQIQSVSAKDVISAYEKYFSPLANTPSKIKWIVVSGKETVEKFDF